MSSITFNSCSGFWLKPSLFYAAAAAVVVIMLLCINTNCDESVDSLYATSNWTSPLPEPVLYLRTSDMDKPRRQIRNPSHLSTSVRADTAQSDHRPRPTNAASDQIFPFKHTGKHRHHRHNRRQYNQRGYTWPDSSVDSVSSKNILQQIWKHNNKNSDPGSIFYVLKDKYANSRQWNSVRARNRTLKQFGRHGHSIIGLSSSSQPQVVKPYATNQQSYANQTVPLAQSFWVDSGQGSVKMINFPDRPNHNKKRHNRQQQDQSKKRPNIIFILTDDQDIELGSMNYMPKTMKILSNGGTQMKNAYVTTPMCCPSRSSILTGLYVHNHNVHTNGENCSSPQWQQTHERRTFATYLRDIGYRTAFFGKYLNEYNGSYIPPGWSDWSALVRNSRYYNYTLNVNGDKVRHGASYELDYYPDLILNDSLQYLRYSKRFFSSKPYLMVMSFPSPHGPEDAAPQFQNMFLGEKRHRTPSWNYAPNLDKQWLLRNTPKMSSIHQEFTDFLNAKRLQTLQSVDEAVNQIYLELKKLGELDNTYIVYTSDHGYHLGQFGLVKGKAMPFEFDIKVPFFIRGPNVPVGKTLPQIVLNIDIAPTLLEIAGIKIPPHMDGISFLPFIKQLSQSSESNSVFQPYSNVKTVYRDSFLIERGKFKVPNNVDRLLIPIIGKKQWLQLECQKPEYQSPCKMFQKFECFQDDSGFYRIRKCQRRLSDSRWRKTCICPPRDNNGTTTLKTSENDVLRQFVSRHHPKRRHKKNPKNKKWYEFQQFKYGRRNRRSDDLHGLLSDEPTFEFDVRGVYELKKLIDVAKTPSLTVPKINSMDSINAYSNSSNSSSARIGADQLNEVSNITTSQLVSILNSASGALFHTNNNSTDYLNQTFCTVTRANLSIECSEEIHTNQEVWRENKYYLNSVIKALQRRLFELKGIRRYINEKRPKSERKTNRMPIKDDDDECDCRNYDPLSRDRSKMDRGQRQLHPLRHNERRAMMKGWKMRKFQRRQEKKLRRKEKFENTTCQMAASEQMNCFTHDNGHWKTPPLWNNGPFCFCQNSANNSFWCMRTINTTHNTLYCEFVTGFISYFDLLKDPYQLQNAIYDLEFSVIEEYSRMLAHLKNCSGSSQCSKKRILEPSQSISTVHNTSLALKAKRKKTFKHRPK